MPLRTYTLKLWPADLQWQIPEGAALQDVLFPRGVEFPCGGRGRCNGCRMRVLSGVLRVTPEETAVLSGAELAGGWRMACCHTMTGDLTLELAQWETPVLREHPAAFAFQPREGLGAAVDLGSTTVAVQLVDLHTGHVLAGTTALNAQARFGADAASRVDHALQGGTAELGRVIHEQLGHILAHLIKLAGRPDPVSRVALVGNTVMHHLFGGLDVTPLAEPPFDPAHHGRLQFTPAELHWPLPDHAVIEFLPCPGGLVGSDILAGIVAVGLHRSEWPLALLDLGTSVEVVVGHRERLLCARAPAAAIFEGVGISHGMRAATGAICAATLRGHQLECRVLGGGLPRGLCGSGLADAVAAGLDRGDILPDGSMPGLLLSLLDPVSLHTQDVRELQRAKSAVAAALHLLTARLSATLDDLRCVFLAGAFGNYVTRASARRIGLIHMPPERVVPAGNTALLGAKRALFEPPEGWDALSQMVEHVPLHDDPQFMEIQEAEWPFPA